jgi:hypothetical protein
MEISLLIIGIITVVIGALAAISQHYKKKKLSFSFIIIICIIGIINLIVQRTKDIDDKDVLDKKDSIINKSNYLLQQKASKIIVLQNKLSKSDSLIILSQNNLITSQKHVIESQRDLLGNITGGKKNRPLINFLCVAIYPSKRVSLRFVMMNCGRYPLKNVSFSFLDSGFKESDFMFMKMLSGKKLDTTSSKIENKIINFRTIDVGRSIVDDNEYEYVPYAKEQKLELYGDVYWDGGDYSIATEIDIDFENKTWKFKRLKISVQGSEVNPFNYFDNLPKDYINRKQGVVVLDDENK